MRLKSLMVVVLVLALAGGCKGKKAKGAGASSGDLKAFGSPKDLGLGEDVYMHQSIDREGKYLLYSIRRDPKEGWGFNHGMELYSYNLELNIKLPLGKLGRSSTFGFVYLGEKEMLAVAKTVDTDDNGDVDERDGNALYVMAPDGLDDEPVSPVRKHVTGYWGDPKGELVIFATADHWEGKVVPPPKEGEKEKEPDWSGVAYTWNFVTKETNELGRCLAFYGVSPDGEQFACLQPDGVGKDGITVTVIPRDGTGNSTVTLPTTRDAQVVPLGGGRLAFTKVESSSTGDRRTLWIRGADGKDARVTSTSVDTDILRPLADGGVLFLSRAEYTVDDKNMLRAISGDGSKVKDLLTLPGADLLHMPVLSGTGKLFSYAIFPTDSFEANPKGIVWLATAKEKAKPRPAAEVAEEKIAGLGETIVEALRKAIDDGSPVKEDEISVNVPGKRAVLPMAIKEEVTDASLLEAAKSLRGAVMPVLAKEGYSAVLPLDGHADAVAVMHWHPEFGRHLTYFVAYNNWVPVRDEYDIVIEDLVYRKLPGCADPRLVQLHCAGWLAAVKDLGTESLDLVCRADPLDPGMKVREGREAVTGVAPGNEAISMDVIADKVDPRRSHRSTFSLLIFKGSQQLPFYDSSWAEATVAWIEVLRGIPGGEVVPTTKLHYFAKGDEQFIPLAKWFPSTVVRQEQHLDTHIFIDEEGTPPMEDKEGWDALATALMESFTPFLEEHDPDNLEKVRVNLYKGQLLMSEMWHKTPEELAIEGCDLGNGDACYQLGLIMMEKGQKMAADYAFYDGCDMGSELACEVISGAGASTSTAGAKPAPEPEAGEPALKKKTALPPGATKEPPKAASLKKSEIQAAIRENLPEVKYCFQKEAAGTGQMAVTVRIGIDGKGKVETVAVKHSNVSQSIETCVLQAVRRIAFPEPPVGQPIKLSYPFTYVP